MTLLARCHFLDVSVLPSAFLLFFIYMCFRRLAHDIDSCGIIWTVELRCHRSLGHVFPCFCQAKCCSRGTGTGCCLMTVFTVCWFSGSARDPTWDQLEQFDWLDRLRWKEGGREDPFLGCFCLSRQADRKAVNVTRWMVSPSSANACCPSSSHD